MALRFTIERQFAQAPDLVFQALTDLDAMKAWMPNLVAMEKVTDGAVGEGTEFRETRRMFSKEASEHFRVSGYEPPKRLELFVDGSKGSSRRGEYRFSYTLRPAGGGTHLTLTSEVSGMGTFMELLGKLFMGPFKKAIAKDLEAMQRHLDGQIGKK